MITNADITIYNKYIDNRAEKYQRSVIRDVVWQAQQGVASQRYQVANNSTMILIPFSQGANYITPKNWQWEDKPSTHWTLQEGDVIVRGVVPEEITAGFTITDLRAAYDEVVSIMSVDAMDQGTPAVQHWELQCK